MASQVARGGRIAGELRRVASRATRQVALHQGRALGMYVGCGFPKSGTVWLCQLMSAYLGLPYPQHYRSPIAMASVTHAHWRYDPRLPPTAYIRRDGRDVMISLYFYQMRTLATGGPPRGTRIRKDLRRVFGAGVDPAAVRDNLPRFLEWQLASPRGSGGLPWHQHVADWWDRPGVGQVSYEGLLAKPVVELSALMETITGQADQLLADLAVNRWSFEVAAGRKAGDEDRQSFLRKGVAGDWRAHFSREAGEIFDASAGDALVELGYVPDRSWWRSL